MADVGARRCAIGGTGAANVPVSVGPHTPPVPVRPGPLECPLFEMPNDGATRPTLPDPCIRPSRRPPRAAFLHGGSSWVVFKDSCKGRRPRSPWPCPRSRGLGRGGQGPGGGSGSGIPAGWRSAVPRTSRHTTRAGAHRDPAGTDDCGGAGHDGKGRAGKSAAQGSHICSPTPAQTGRHPRQPQPVPVPVPPAVPGRQSRRQDQEPAP